MKLLKQELEAFSLRVSRFRAAFKRDAPFFHPSQVLGWHVRTHATDIRAPSVEGAHAYTYLALDRIPPTHLRRTTSTCVYVYVPTLSLTPPPSY